jgi:putative peptidoglycan lipid II flippase
MLSAAFFVIVATLAVKFVATAKEFTVAGIFGRSDALEAFLAAALVPGLLINLVAESMNQALVPTLVRVKTTEGRERAQQLLSNTLVWTCILLVTASLGMGLTARLFFPLIGSHFAPGKLNLAVQLFYGLLPVVVLTGVASLGTSLLTLLDVSLFRHLHPSPRPSQSLSASHSLPAGWGSGRWFTALSPALWSRRSGWDG